MFLASISCGVKFWIGFKLIRPSHNEMNFPVELHDYNVQKHVFSRMWPGEPYHGFNSDGSYCSSVGSISEFCYLFCTAASVLFSSEEDIVFRDGAQRSAKKIQITKGKPVIISAQELVKPISATFILPANPNLPLFPVFGIHSEGMLIVNPLCFYCHSTPAHWWLYYVSFRPCYSPLKRNWLIVRSGLLWSLGSEDTVHHDGHLIRQVKQGVVLSNVMSFSIPFTANNVIMYDWLIVYIHTLLILHWIHSVVMAPIKY